LDGAGDGREDAGGELDSYFPAESSPLQDYERGLWLAELAAAAARLEDVDHRLKTNKSKILGICTRAQTAIREGQANGLVVASGRTLFAATHQLRAAYEDRALLVDERRGHGCLESHARYVLAALGPAESGAAPQESGAAAGSVI